MSFFIGPYWLNSIWVGNSCLLIYFWQTKSMLWMVLSVLANWPRLLQCCEFGCQTSNFGNWQSDSATDNFFWQLDFFWQLIQYTKDIRTEKCFKMHNFNPVFAKIPGWGPRPPMERSISLSYPMPSMRSARLGNWVPQLPEDFCPLGNCQNLLQKHCFFIRLHFGVKLSLIRCI